MDHKTRVMTALDNQQPDRVPIFESNINEPVLQELREILGIAGEENGGEQSQIVSQESGDGGKKVDLYCDVVDTLGIDATCYKVSIELREVGDGKGEDKFRRVYRLSPHGEPLPVESRISGLEDLENFDMAAQLQGNDLRSVERVIQRFGESRAHFLTLIDPFKIGWRNRGGMQKFLMDFRRNQELVHALNRKATDYLLAVIDRAVELGIDAFLMNGDYADERGLIFSREDYVEYFRPYHQQLVEKVHQKGKKIIKHTDGKAWDLMEEFVKVGFDGFHPIQPQCMDIEEVKAKYGDQLCLVGNIDCRELLVNGNPEEVRRTVKETILKAGAGGGYMISSSNSIHPGVKPENYLAMVEATKEHGEYPL